MRMKHLGWFICLFSLIALVSACPDDPDGDGDTDGDMDSDADGDGDSDIEIEPPAPPEPPVLTPCPPGWREVESEDSEGVITCDPWPEGGPEDCAIDEAHFPGEPGCIRIGTACPAGEWAEDLPADAPILYVLDGAPVGGDGTQASPLSTIAAAMDEAESGTIIALSKGTFDEEVTVSSGVTLWGACVAETQVNCPEPADFRATININGTGTVVRNLRVSGARSGIRVEGLTTSAHLEDVAVYRSTNVGIALTENASASGQSVVVRDTQAFEGGVVGRGLQVYYGAYFEATRIAFENNRDQGVIAQDELSTMILTDIVIRGTQQGVGNAYGYGLNVGYGARAEVTRAVIEENWDTEVLVTDDAATMMLTDAVVRDTRTSDTSGTGRGVQVQRSAVAHLSRVSVEGNEQVGIQAYGMNSSITMTDVVVLDSRSDEDGKFGQGLQVDGGASAEVVRALIERNQNFGVGVFGTGTSLTATDLIIRHTRQPDLEEGGLGLVVADRGQTEMTRAIFDANQSSGALIRGAGSAAILTDTSITNTASDDDGEFGRGLTVDGGATAEVLRATIVRNRDVGVLASEEGTTVRLNEVEVRETRERECARDTCADEGAGHGMSVRDDAHVDATGIIVSQSALCGVQLALGGTMDLHNGVIDDNPIGANVQTEDFDWDRLLDNVTFSDNERDFDSVFLPVPDPSLPTDWLLDEEEP